MGGPGGGRKALTVAGPAEPVFQQLNPNRSVKLAIAIALFSAAMHYLVSGRKEADFGKMVTGAILALASLAFL